MAHFRGTIQGARGEASRLGTKKSGLEVEANGWEFGVTVELFHRNGRDMVRIYLTDGSRQTQERLFGIYSLADLEKPPEPLS